MKKETINYEENNYHCSSSLPTISIPGQMKNVACQDAGQTVLQP